MMNIWYNQPFTNTKPYRSYSNTPPVEPRVPRYLSCNNQRKVGCQKCKWKAKYTFMHNTNKRLKITIGGGRIQASIAASSALTRIPNSFTSVSLL